MTATVFEAEGLSKEYPSGVALDQLCMSIEAGDVYGFVGENGAGKTTLMRIIGGLVHPTAGRMALFGEQSKERQIAARRRVGFLIERPSLYPHMNAMENLCFYCRIFGIRDKGRSAEVLKLVGLDEAGPKKAGEYSLGMRQRLGIAVALLNRPEFLVLDEPVNGLDPAGIVEVRHILEQLSREQGVTLLISSHILSELQLLAGKYGFIHQGRLIQEISAAELQQTAQVMICISTSSPAAAVAEMLRQELRRGDIRIKQTGEIELPRSGVDLERLMSLLVQREIPVDGFQLTAPNLEQYYMDLIGGGGR
ncbi:multidrug ABC transporter ATPase [Paenibacillus sp. FSL R7-277]|uniref:ABC transporter ATP-binding protein n=1 Tax=Paenibacillus sp. FSL R7-277 TaxID=1227352 RepID=UPI0003E20BBB|nr:ATP-binding cassette domain-containing protein [Paenibacillus sp. FSL R7-277]ETT76514.1 multidrug ABC transporter ATPase [Paenibacillus sp. FSL R7-277]